MNRFAMLASVLVVWILLIMARIRRHGGWAARWRDTTAPFRDRCAVRNGLIAFGLYGLLAVATMDFFAAMAGIPAAAVVTVISHLAYRRHTT